MIIKRFRAEGFRNIEKCDIEFSPGVNLLYGKNAQGKTNIIEGIYLFSRGKSFRGREDKELVKFDSEGFRIYVEFEDKFGEESLEYSVFGKERLRKKNGYRINKITDFVGSIKAVLFYPDNMNLVKGSPEERRSFLNIAISQYNPVYLRYYQNYKKTLENRNHDLRLLQKGFPVDREELLAWSRTLSEYAALIYLVREEYIEKLKYYSKIFSLDISGGKEKISIFYECDIENGLRDIDLIKERFEKVFTQELDREISAGTTLFGPHRDDLQININDRDSRLFASQGQQRSIVLSLKLSEGEIIKEVFGEYPVFLLDDVLSELDYDRRKYLLDKKGEKQIIITSCQSEELKEIADKTIEVSGGTYS
jgi:DNA replication and repair protein RecF